MVNILWLSEKEREIKREEALSHKYRVLIQRKSDREKLRGKEREKGGLAKRVEI